MTHRPLLHFTPAHNWMNDPNGLVFHDGLYHLYFQHNPNGLDHATIGWGHATSADLLTWREHPLAIAADDVEQIWSGSIVVDHENTAGFAGPGQTALVAIYTSMSQATGIQAQSLAASLDGGYTWTKYPGNPVLDRGSREFRDPKVFRYDGVGGAYWVMVAVEAVDRQVLLYRSDDLKSWSLLSSYGPAGAVGGVWECPDLFPLAVDGDLDDVRWVMLISLNPGGIAGGSGTQYVVGRFDGVRFTPDVLPAGVASTARECVDWLDYGRDCYAGVTFQGLPDDERTLIAWMSNWDYARTMPGGPYRGAMTTPRRLALTVREGRPQLTVTPVLPAGVPIEVGPDADRVRLPRAARVDVRGATAIELEFSCADGPTVRVLCAPGEVVVDRCAASGIHSDFPSVERMRVPDGDGAVSIVLDAGSVEVFACDGVRSLTDLVPWSGEVTLRIADRSALAQLAIHDLAPRATAGQGIATEESLLEGVDSGDARSRHVGEGVR